MTARPAAETVLTNVRRSMADVEAEEATGDDMGENFESAPEAAAVPG
jgi:hypothetical protein